MKSNSKDMKWISFRGPHSEQAECELDHVSQLPTQSYFNDIKVSLIQNVFMWGPGDMAQWVKFLSHKCEELNLNPKIHV